MSEQQPSNAKLTIKLILIPLSGRVKRVTISRALAAELAVSLVEILAETSAESTGDYELQVFE